MTPAIESRSTATTTCTSCGTTLSADSNGSIWDAVRELGRLRDARGWLTDHAYGRRWCPGCVADGAPMRALPPVVEVGAVPRVLMRDQAPSIEGNALPQKWDSGSVEGAPGDQGAAAAGRQSNGSDLANVLEARDP